MRVQRRPGPRLMRFAGSTGHDDPMIVRADIIRLPLYNVYMFITILLA